MYSIYSLEAAMLLKISLMWWCLSTSLMLRFHPSIAMRRLCNMQNIKQPKAKLT